LTLTSVHPARIETIYPGVAEHGPVVYWMSRDQRAEDNWALFHASNLAKSRRVPLVVVFCLVPSFCGAGRRQYDFMLDGLRETAATLAGHDIPFVLLFGEPSETLPAFIARHRCGMLVTDNDPLVIKRRWREAVTARISIPCDMVDAHNIVPAALASDHQEYGAYTIRKKITSRLGEFLTPFPVLDSSPHPWGDTLDRPDWETIAASLPNTGPQPVESIAPGGKTALDTLFSFLGDGFHRYARSARDPNAGTVSGLSPYLHFGQLSAQRAALETEQLAPPGDENAEVFLEQLIVRRELADNFCRYAPSYETFAAIPRWAQETLDRHRTDPREYMYTFDQFEQAQTHDPLWNAAQCQMTCTGTMHGYLRMYWAKKILEWSSSPEQALETAILLNDRWQLDGRDPNGYTGILWSIGGLHDRPWRDRPVYGSIRYMSENGARGKFDVDAYIARYS
jgi:deoxyribodipyrimidine photo-lyase